MARLYLVFVGLLVICMVSASSRKQAMQDSIKRRMQRQILHDSSRQNLLRHRQAISGPTPEPPAPEALEQLTQILTGNVDSLQDGSRISFGDGQGTLVVRRRQKVLTRSRSGRNRTRSGSNSLSHEQWRGRLRSKHARVFKIQQQILQSLKFSKKPDLTKLPSNNNGVMRILNNIMNNQNFSQPRSDSAQSHTSFTRSFHAKSVNAACEAPRNSDESWFSDQVLRLFFPFDISKEEGMVSSAELRLFIKTPMIEEETDEARGRQRRHEQDEDYDYDEGEEEEADSDDDIDDLATNNSSLSIIARDRLRLVVYRYRRPPRPNRKGKKVLIHEQWLNKSQKGWIDINIKDTAALWAENPRRNLGIEVLLFNSDFQPINPMHYFNIYNCSEENSSEVLQSEVASNSSMLNSSLTGESTFAKLDILTMTIPKSNSRQKRESSPIYPCSMETVYIPLEDGGMGRILQPRGFDAGFCTGSCSPWTEPKDGLQRAVDTQCCGPSSYEPLLILHYDDEMQLTVSIMDDLIVSSCSCRS